MEYLLKMLFFANIASNLKVESMHLAHRNCEYILGVIYLFVFPVLLWADNKVNTYHFKSISTSVNFPTNEVRKLFQDSQGYIWISTYNGLLRYDGYSIVVYKPDGVNHGRSIDSFVNMVAEDKENNLWIGTEIERENKNGETEILTKDWYYNHEFDDAELRMLIDSILFSKTIPRNQAQELIEKIKGLSNVYFSAKVQHVCNLPGLSHTDNRQTMLNVEMIDDAISEGKKVAFLYNTYGIDKHLHPRKDTKYIVNPYQMVANEGKYYLICNYDKYDNLSNYRIDRMTEIEILDEKVKDKSLVKGMEHGLNLPQHMAEHLYMFSDSAATIVLKVQKGNMGDIVDWFDKNFEVLSPKFVQNNYPDNFNPEADANKAFIRVTCSQNAMFHWAMQYGTSVEVIEPADLRERIRNAVNEMAERYK